MSQPCTVTHSKEEVSQGGWKLKHPVKFSTHLGLHLGADAEEAGHLQGEEKHAHEAAHPADDGQHINQLQQAGTWQRERGRHSGHCSLTPAHGTAQQGLKAGSQFGLALAGTHLGSKQLPAAAVEATIKAHTVLGAGHGAIGLGHEAFGGKQAVLREQGRQSRHSCPTHWGLLSSSKDRAAAAMAGNQNATGLLHRRSFAQALTASTPQMPAQPCTAMASTGSSIFRMWELR